MSVLRSQSLNQPQQRTSSQPSRLNVNMRPLVAVQRTSGNQAEPATDRNNDSINSATTRFAHDFSQVPGRRASRGPAGISVHVRQRGSEDDIATAARIAANRSSVPLIEVLSVDELAESLNTLAGSSRCIGHLTIWNHGSPQGQLLGLRSGREGFTSQWLLNPGENLPTLNLLRQSLCCGATMTWLGCSTSAVIAHGGHRTEEEMRTIAEHHLDVNEYQSVADAEAHGAVVFGFGSGLINVRSWSNATCANIQAANAPTLWNPRTMPGSYSLLSNGRFVSVPAPGGQQCACNAATGRVGPISLAQFGAAIEPIEHVFISTLRDIAGEITLPPGLPYISPDRAHFAPRPSESGDAAETQAWRIFCRPLDPWSWIIFTPNVILHTRERTRAVMEHELEHCADFYRSLMAFREQRMRRRSEGEHIPDEPSAPANICNISHEPPEQPAMTPFWRFYYDWIHYLRGIQDPQRHLEIYEQERRTGEFDSWSVAERQEWLQAALSDAMPTTQIQPAQLLPIESWVNERFQSRNEVGKRAYINSFIRAIHELCDVSGGTLTDATRGNNHVRLWNLFSHFEPIHMWWAAHDRITWNLSWQRAYLTAERTWRERGLGQPRFAAPPSASTTSTP